MKWCDSFARSALLSPSRPVLVSLLKLDEDTSPTFAPAAAAAAAAVGNNIWSGIPPPAHPASFVWGPPRPTHRTDTFADFVPYPVRPHPNFPPYAMPGWTRPPIPFTTAAPISRYVFDPQDMPRALPVPTRETGYGA